MIVTRKTVARRTMLRGLGAAVSLPLLDAMVPALTALARTPAKSTARFGVVYIPMGAVMNNWTPAETGAGFPLSPILEPIGSVPRPHGRADQPGQRTRGREAR